MTNDLRILLVQHEDSGDSVADLLRNDLSCNVDWEREAREVALNRDPFKYNVAIIDASDDGIVDRHHSLSEWLKSRNPELIIIGTSIMGAFFEHDNLSCQLYDEKITRGVGYSEFVYQLKERLQKYGFEFQEENSIE